MLEPWVIVAAIVITGFSGFVKGTVGFAMPMIMMSAFGSIMPATTALALMILPTLVTNIAQAFRQGWRAALETVVKYRWHIGMIVLFIPISSRFATAIPTWLMFLLLGVPITAFALWQLSGRPMILPIHHRRRAQIIGGIIGGLYGGISGIWGTPIIIYMMSVGAEKREQVRVQGVVFLIGAVVLFASHLRTGVLNAHTLPLSALMVVPGMLGLWAGFALQDRLNVVQFRRWTQILLVLSGLNLVRRAIELWD